MYHTIEARLQLGYNSFYAYKEKLANASAGVAKFYEDSKSNEKNKIWHSELLKNNGVYITLARFTPNEYTIFSLILRINPKRLLNNDDFISVTHEFETEMIYAEMDRLLYSIGIFEIFGQFKISRIDYCCNCAFENEFIAGCYMELLKRSAKLDGFEIALTYSTKQHRKITDRNALYAYNNSVNINIYNKYQEMCNRPEIYQGNLERSQGIIRFEMQCLKQKISSMKYSNDLPDRGASHWMKEELSEKTILSYINKIFVKGDYCTLDIARQKVLDGNFREDTKKVMLRLLELSNEKRSLMKALDTLYQEGFQKKYLDSIMEKFEMINVNTVSIPINWGIPHFDSPYNIVVQEINRNIKI